MSGLYDKAREAYLSGDLDWSSDTVKLVAVSSGYSPNLAGHQYLSSISNGARVATSQAFTGKTETAGVADADDVTLPAVTGSQIIGVAIYKEGIADSSSPLIAYVDTGPVTPNGADITLQWDAGPNRIFTL